MYATLLGDRVNAVMYIPLPLLHSFGQTQVSGAPLSQERGELPKGVTTGGRDHGGFLKVYLSILNLDPGGFPRLAFLCLTSSFQNFVRTSSLVLSCFRRFSLACYW